MLKKIIKLITAFSLLPGSFVLANFALAQSDYGIGIGGALNLGDAEPRVVVIRIIQIILGFLGILAVGFIIYGGFLWMTSAGDESRVEKARKILISAVIGLIIILSSLAIATYVINRMSSITGAPGGSGDDGGGGNIPPGGGGDGSVCDSNTLTPACEADDSLCADGFYCSIFSCSCRALGGEGDSCDADDDLAGCQANSLSCGPGLYCDNNSCTCEIGDGVGQSCDADGETDGCQADQNFCSRGLVCDSFGASPTCTCIPYPIIEDISPVGGFCENNINDFCTGDSDCPGSVCDQETPNGAPGNIITISGYHFGAVAGSVLFWDGSGFSVTASFPNNPLCDDNWSDNRIIVTVPAGAQSGPIRIITADSDSEDTNNEIGDVLPDFIVNSIGRPGLCAISPGSGSLGEEISYYGLNMNNSTAEFGSWNAAVAGRNSSFSAQNGSALVPNIRIGNTTTFVFSTAGVPSNYLRFSKTDEAGRGPRIISFDPVIGAPGQYITIYGSGFGSAQNDSALYFGSAQTGTEADYSFPEVCADNVWSDDQILIKVPAGIINGNYILTIEVNDQTTDSASLSPGFFSVDSLVALRPSLCRINPVMAPVGEEIELWGEYFGNFDVSLSRVRFYNNRDVFGSGRLPLWEEERISGDQVYHVRAIVPDGAITGPVRVVKDSPEVVGNGLNLQIGSCLEALDPEVACAGQVCCPVGTYAAGRCVNSLNDCAIDIPSSVFEWDFSTRFDLGGDDPINQSCADRHRDLDICPSGACFNSPGECSAGGEECECCCRKANGNNDCCEGLICEGVCGTDRNSDTGSYGACSGCRVEIGGVVDQAASDAACNCEGSSYAKYCDVDVDVDGDGSPDGVCGDCASLSPESCTAHSATCCVNGTNENTCAGRQFAPGEGNIFDLVTRGGLAYCGYHICDVGGGCSASNPTAFPGNSERFNTNIDCQLNCGGAVNLGLSCEGQTVDVCDNSICFNPFSCQAGYEGGCGYCCCDPANDQCSALNSDLVCQPDVSPCSTAERGLCCGCSDNSQCVPGGGDPISAGCGIDSCCRARPSVVAHFPADGSTDACTNAVIYADFNQTMQTGSFRGNVLVAGEYSGDCPSDTVLLSLGRRENKNKFYSFFNKAFEFFHNIFGNEAQASPGPDPAMNYCAISGSTVAEQIGEDSTRLIFRPTGILDVGVKYFVIIKGDDRLDNSNGVRSAFGIGMYTGDGSPVDNTSSFGSVTFTRTTGGIVYNPAYIWSFTTRNNGRQGLCDIASVDIKPSSYLFNKIENDLNENDIDPEAESFDKTKDSDKVFVANAYSSDGQKLYPVAGYSWQWDWDSSNTGVAAIVAPGPFGINEDSQLVRALDNILDGRTQITATVDITDSSVSDIGDGFVASADVYVFICENPWPAVAGDFTWEPWRDSDSNCLPSTGTCLDTGQEIYYCRDRGESGPADDLPAVSDGTIRGSGSDILKESYFFDQN